MVWDLISGALGAVGNFIGSAISAPIKAVTTAVNTTMSLFAPKATSANSAAANITTRVSNNITQQGNKSNRQSTISSAPIFNAFPPRINNSLSSSKGCYTPIPTSASSYSKSRLADADKYTKRAENVPVEKPKDILGQIGDIISGVSNGFSDLIIAFIKGAGSLAFDVGRTLFGVGAALMDTMTTIFMPKPETIVEHLLEMQRIMIEKMAV